MIAIEEGVSEKLAAHRKKVLSNVRYTISLTIPAEREEAIEGDETITFHLKKDANPLQLDFKEAPSHIKNVWVNNKKINPLVKNEHIVIEQQYLRGGTNNIRIVFTAGELSLNRNNDYLYTLLVPDRARTVLPCFDQPNIKAKFQLSLTIPQQWQAMANAPLKDSVIEAGRKTYYFQESDVFSTYLFSFVAGKFSLAEKTVNGRPMRFYFRETDSAKIRLSLDTIFGLHGSALDFLERYTSIPYPFQKLDFAAIPDFQYGGMEHVGAIDYKASTLFLDAGATKDQENARGSLIAHETAHMWFGDLVTMQWFNDVWMKEVFANFMADKITQGAQSNNTYELKYLLTHFPRAYSIDRTAGANPIRQQLPNLKEAGSLYGPIIYNKAPVMMRQLERLMGADAFREGVKAYLKKFSFGNATWPDLIRILDKRTPANLESWNRVWVNTPGRPQFSCQLTEKNKRIASLVISQKGERSQNYLLPQFFEIALIYADRVEEVTVNMNARSVVVNEVKSKELPLAILFNSSGQGYGLFPATKNMADIHRLTNPVMRAAAYINAYENMLSGVSLTPTELLQALLQTLQEGKESEELILSMITGHISDIYWRLINPAHRKQMAGKVETILWQAMQNDSVANQKKILFRTFQNTAYHQPALDTLYHIWKEQKPPTGVKLSEDEYTSLALNLAVKAYPNDTILITQANRITNPDRKQRLRFLLPAVSNEVNTRDAFFASLKDVRIRKKEAWVADALAYLHHPLRTSTSIKYLDKSLAMLKEIQETGDIFFPAAWLNASFGSYNTKQAADIIRNFLKRNPGYNAQLKMKILQAADPVFRAEKLLN